MGKVGYINACYAHNGAFSVGIVHSYIRIAYRIALGVVVVEGLDSRLRLESGTATEPHRHRCRDAPDLQGV